MIPFPDTRTFTDEQKEQLRDDCTAIIHTRKDTLILALLHRLEKAEKYATMMRENNSHGWFQPEYNAWRKSKGEAGK